MFCYVFIDVSMHDAPVSYEDAQHEVLLNQVDSKFQLYCIHTSYEEQFKYCRIILSSFYSKLVYFK